MLADYHVFGVFRLMNGVKPGVNGFSIKLASLVSSLYSPLEAFCCYNYVLGSLTSF